MLVRRARPEDAPTVEALYRILVPGDAHVRVDPERLRALAADPNNQLFVAQREEGVCGTAFLTLCLDAMYGSQPFGTLENVVVDPAARGLGVGRALLVAVERAARAASCTKLMLLSSRYRTEAHAFFEHCGFDGGPKRAFVKYLRRSPAL